MVAMHRILAFTVLSFTSVAMFGSPSFDCAKAKNFVEKMICSDVELSMLDQSLSDAYTSAREEKSNASLRYSQKKWLDMRDKCDSRECVMAAYVMRVSELHRGQKYDDLIDLSPKQMMEVCQEAILGTLTGRIRDYYLTASGDRHKNFYKNLDLDGDGVSDEIETNSGSFEAILSVNLSSGGGFEHADGIMALVELNQKNYVVVTYRDNSLNGSGLIFHNLKMLTGHGVVPICDSWPGRKFDNRE